MVTRNRWKKGRASFPDGVLGIYDNGGRTIDQYAVVYTPYQLDGMGLIFPNLTMSANPFWPQGVCLHGETVGFRPTTMQLGRMINFDELPQDCQTVITDDLAQFHTQEEN